MPLTPTDVHNVAFKKPPIGKRGYDEEEVDAFLDEVERELARLVEENSYLRGQVGSVNDDGGRQMLTEIASIRAQLERVRRDKEAAEHAAIGLQTELDDVCGKAAGQAEGPNARVIMMAKRTADDHMSDARQEADKVLTDARIWSQEVLQTAQAEAEAVEREARERHQMAIEKLEENRAALLQQISRLGTFAMDYRSRLREALTSRLQETGNVSAEDGHRLS